MELIFILFMKEDAGQKCMKRLVLPITDSNSNILPKQKVMKNTVRDVREEYNFKQERMF